MTQYRRIVLLLAVLLMAEPVFACPMCKEALASRGGDLVSGFFYSILFMLSMPFMIVTGMGTYLYMLVRKARAAQAEQGACKPQPFAPPAVDSPGTPKAGTT